MSTLKISAMTDGVTANATDIIPMVRSGLNKYITPAYIQTYILGNIGLLARYHLSTSITSLSAGADVINFNTSDYDPLSMVTTGAAWHATIPTGMTGWYDIRIVEAFVDPNGNAWTNSGDGIKVKLLKNGSNAADLAYWDAEGSAGVDKFPFLYGTRGISLAAADTIALRFDNFSGHTRKLNSPAAVEIYRVH